MYRTVEAVGLSSAKVCLFLLKIGFPIKIGKKLLKRLQIICMHKCKHSFRLYCRFIATTQLPALLLL